MHMNYYDQGATSRDLILNYTTRNVAVVDTTGKIKIVKPIIPSVDEINSIANELADSHTRKFGSLNVPPEFKRDHIYILRLYETESEGMVPDTGVCRFGELYRFVNHIAYPDFLNPKCCHVKEIKPDDFHLHGEDGGLYVPEFGYSFFKHADKQNVSNLHLRRYHLKGKNRPGVVGLRIAITGPYDFSGRLFANIGGVIMGVNPGHESRTRSHVIVYASVGGRSERVIGESSLEDALRGKLSVRQGDRVITIKLYRTEADAFDEGNRVLNEALNSQKAKHEAEMEAARAKHEAELKKERAEKEKAQKDYADEKSRTEDAKAAKRKAESGFWKTMATAFGTLVSFVGTLFTAWKMAKG